MKKSYGKETKGEGKESEGKGKGGRGKMALGRGVCVICFRGIDASGHRRCDGCVWGSRG